jgi:hypothetical protein
LERHTQEAVKALSKYVALLEKQLQLAQQQFADVRKQLAEAREDIEFYRGKVERLELAIMSNPPAQQEYAQTQTIVRPAIQSVKAQPQTPPRMPFMDLKAKWNAMSAEEQEKAMQDGWQVDQEATKEADNAGQ